jgi:hypothetical protein
VGPSATFEPADHPWLTTLLIVMVAVVSLVVLAWLVVLARGLWRRASLWWVRRRETPGRLVADFDVLESPDEALAQVVIAQAERQRAALAAGGSPRNAIVECWHRFEELGAEVGLQRHPWETSSEFTLRVLDLAEADGAAVARLGGLYREARFSEHPLGEDARTAALGALEAVHESLRSRALLRAGGVS